MASCLKNGLDHGVGHPWLPLGPRRSTSAPQARGVQRLYRDAEGSQGAETVSEAYALPPRFSHGRIHALGRCHIGGVAYCVLVLPPNCRWTAQRRIQVHRRTTVADAVIKALE